MKSWMLFGRRGGEEFYVEHDTRDDARREATGRLADGYDVHLLNSITGECWGLKQKKALRGMDE